MGGKKSYRLEVTEESEGFSHDRAPDSLVSITGQSSEYSGVVTNKAIVWALHNYLDHGATWQSFWMCDSRMVSGGFKN